MIGRLVPESHRAPRRKDRALAADAVRGQGPVRALAVLHCLLVLAIFFATGCSTHAKRITQSRNLFYEGQLDACRLELEKLHKASRQDRDVTNLDLAIVHLLDGRPKDAEARLREVRDRFDHLEQTSIAEKTVSMWTDDSVRAYAGEDYEKILIRVFLALSSLMQDAVDAESYTLQIQEKHDAILAKQNANEQPVVSPPATEGAPDPNGHPDGSAPNRPVPIEPMVDPIKGQKSYPRYQGLPIGFYLRGMLRERTRQNYDDAERSYSLAAALEPDCVPLQWDVARARQGVHSQPGNGVVYVFALVGRGPYKVEVAERPTSDALLIADRIVSAVGPYQVPPTLAPIKVPDVVTPPRDIDSLFVSLDGSAIGPTESLADIESLAEGTYRANRNQIIARAVARRVIKKATVVTAKNSMGANDLTSLGMDIAGVAWEATESADTRCWGLLPRDVQFLRVEAPAGLHRIQIAPSMSGFQSHRSSMIDVRVDDGRNTYILCWAPDASNPACIMSATH